MTITQKSQRRLGNPKFTKCFNCDAAGYNDGPLEFVSAFETVIQNKPVQVNLKDAVGEIFGQYVTGLWCQRKPSQSDIDENDCSFCVHCSLIFSQLYGLFQLLKGRRGLSSTYQQNAAAAEDIHEDDLIDDAAIYSDADPLRDDDPADQVDAEDVIEVSHVISLANVPDPLESQEFTNSAKGSSTHGVKVATAKKIQSHKCSKCPRKFISKTQVQYHECTAHQPTVVISTTGAKKRGGINRKCLCGRSFSSPSMLNQHRRTCSKVSSSKVSKQAVETCSDASSSKVSNGTEEICFKAVPSSLATNEALPNSKVFTEAEEQQYHTSAEAVSCFEEGATGFFMSGDSNFSALDMEMPEQEHVSDPEQDPLDYGEASSESPSSNEVSEDESSSDSDHEFSSSKRRKTPAASTTRSGLSAPKRASSTSKTSSRPRVRKSRARPDKACYSKKLEPEVTYCCRDCPATFDSPRLLGKHRTETHNDRDRPFKCHECDDGAFNNSERLKVHLINVHRDVRPFVCNLCPKAFKLLSSLTLHMRNSHKTILTSRLNTPRISRATGFSVTYQCQQCGELFQEAELYSKHKMDVHGASAPLECSQCGKKYYSSDALTKHEKWHEEVALGGGYPCNDCDKRFETRLLLSKHRLKEHVVVRQTGSGGDWACETCGKSYLTKERLNDHEKTHVPAKCNYCDYEGTEKSMYCHVRNMHRDKYEEVVALKAQMAKKKQVEEGSEGYKCFECDQTFRRARQMALHRVSAHGVPEDSMLKCTYCMTEFGDARKFVDHVKSHDESEDWPCGECHLRFRQKMLRNRHLLEAHGIQKTSKDEYFPLPPARTFRLLAAEENPLGTVGEWFHKNSPVAREYKCAEPGCEEQFTGGTKLGIHREVVHGVSKEERFKCHICLKCYTQESTLANHLERHSGLRRHLCDECGKNFGSSNDLAQHWKLMHSEEWRARLKATGKRWREKQKAARAAQRLSVEPSVDDFNSC